MTSSGRTSGILLLDKPRGLTSHDVVARTRRAAGTRKVGHAGTLDPMATGLLILGLNSSTRLLTYVVGLDKQYDATIRLGAATTTDDAEGEITVRAEAGVVDALQHAAVEAALAQLTGDVLQRPSSVSAIKVDGKRAYARVREGEEVVLKARPVTIAAIDLLATRPGLDGESPVLDLDVRVTCSSGTYIRAIARDLGEALDVGGHLTALRRTRIGPFGLDRAHELEHLDPQNDLLPPAQVAAELFSVALLDAAQAADLRNGKKIPFDGAAGTTFAAVDPEADLIGLFEVRNGLTKVLVNFPADETGAA
ncbi:tRNA pseudouridine(55) synthase TruB [Subtercola endophyticus]|uniref:tRNA pseudouridine(55) synthase TruB n=1 Tax=Subtercola endophyticus TaxID=2895559 RepID=UPI001E306F4D|nr:tRNA pseudouridine(55) synthase TruB [Subtercola endophyticus]UFS60091.1 tRNA pseudouridine(55) synthase TruB [Subtercola endophyticus]